MSEDKRVSLVAARESLSRVIKGNGSKEDAALLETSLEELKNTRARADLLEDFLNDVAGYFDGEKVSKSSAEQAIEEYLKLSGR